MAFLFMLCAAGTVVVTTVAIGSADDLKPGDSFVVEGSRDGDPETPIPPIQANEVKEALDKVAADPTFAIALRGGYEVIGTARWGGPSGRQLLGIVVTIQLNTPLSGPFRYREISWPEDDRYKSTDGSAEFVSIPRIEIWYDATNQSVAHFGPGDGTVFIK